MRADLVLQAGGDAIPAKRSVAAQGDERVLRPVHANGALSHITAGQLLKQLHHLLL